MWGAHAGGLWALHMALALCTSTAPYISLLESRPTSHVVLIDKITHITPHG